MVTRDGRGEVAKMPRLLFITTSGLQCSSPPGSHLLRRSSIPSRLSGNPERGRPCPQRRGACDKLRLRRGVELVSRQLEIFQHKVLPLEHRPSRFAPSGPMELWRRSKSRRLLILVVQPRQVRTRLCPRASSSTDQVARGEVPYERLADKLGAVGSELARTEFQNTQRGRFRETRGERLAPSAPIITLLRSSSWRSWTTRCTAPRICRPPR